MMSNMDNPKLSLSLDEIINYNNNRANTDASETKNRIKSVISKTSCAEDRRVPGRHGLNVRREVGHRHSMQRNHLYASDPVKLEISNLNYSVAKEDIFELFEMFGEILYCEMRYSKSGKPIGTGYVIFQRYSDAQRATNRYNGKSLHGRPMNVRIPRMESSPNIRQDRRPIKSVKRLCNGPKSSQGRGRDRKSFRKNKEVRKALRAEQIDFETDEFIVIDEI